MELGSDTFPRDEVTGLAAFDHLDPISTLSALHQMPEPMAPTPRIFTPPPPPRISVAPPRQYVSAKATLPPPGVHAARTFSRPPEIATPRLSMPPAAAVPAESLRADATEVIDIPAEGTGNAFESWEDPEDAATRVASSMADGRPAHSTDLHMDWDEEEPPTQMRGEGGVQQPPPVVGVDWEDDGDTYVRDDGLTSAYQPVPESGRPSPFPSARAGAASVASVAVPSVRPGAPSPFVTSASETAWGQDLRGDNRTYWVVAGAAVAIVALGFAVRAFFAAPTPGLATLVTVPSDARVVVDGRAVAGTSSPFSVTDLAPGVSHEVVVQRDGYLEHRSTFTLSEGEAKALSTVRLAAIAREVGVVIDSVPAGAEVRIDGQPTGQLTPARLTDVPAGMHKLELVHPGHAPFELQVLVPKDAVLHVPTAQLLTSNVAAAPQAPAAQVSDAHTSDRPRARHHRASRRHGRGRVASTARAPAMKRVAVAAPAGGKGVLRINSRPWAQVYVDGKLMGNTPQMGIQLAPGKHSVKLVNQPMGLVKTLSVSVKSGQTVTQVLNLGE